MRDALIGRTALAAAVAGILAGCLNFSEEVAPKREADTRPDLAQRETVRIAEAFREKALSPLWVSQKFNEMADAMQNGTLDFSRGEFFSGMTDEALLRQAMLTWELAPLFEKMRDGSRIAVAVENPRDRILHQALTALLAANSEKVAVVERGDGLNEQELVQLSAGDSAGKAERADYFLRARSITQDLFRSWSLNKYDLPYLRRYAAASAWLELCDLRENRIVWSGPVESFRNYVGDYGPLLWFHDAAGQEVSAMAISPEIVGLVRRGSLEGYAFGPSNELLTDRAFRRIPLSGSVLAGLAGSGKSVVVLVERDRKGGEYADSIRSLLLANGIAVRFPRSYRDFAERQKEFSENGEADYVLLCRVDYAGASALPDAPGSGTFRRQGAVVLWAELIEWPGRKVVWTGQLTGKSEVETDPLLFYPVIFRDQMRPESGSAGGRSASVPGR
ncbi:MAG: hypothetical protein HPZ91_00065 [Lentisphaeria bacterium]|nr:hypothetical protein [Lentisphaeria bacterium]